MTIENLTEEERRSCWAGCEKALRIIDQLTAALEATRSQRNDAQELLDRNMVASRARAEALQARTEELEAQNAQAEQQLTAFGESTVRLLDRAEAAESELAYLRGRVNTAIAALNQFGGTHRGAKVALEALRGPR